MPQRQGAHRALELLEEFHDGLEKPQDRALRNAIERVIRIFKSRLFQVKTKSTLSPANIIALLPTYGLSEHCKILPLSFLFLVEMERSQCLMVTPAPLKLDQTINYSNISNIYI